MNVSNESKAYQQSKALIFRSMCVIAFKEPSEISAVSVSSHMKAFDRTVNIRCWQYAVKSHRFRSFGLAMKMTSSTYTCILAGTSVLGWSQHWCRHDKITWMNDDDRHFKPLRAVKCVCLVATPAALCRQPFFKRMYRIQKPLKKPKH